MLVKLITGLYSQNLIKLQTYDEEHAFGNSKKPDWFIEGNEPKSLPGRHKGLYLMLDAHSDKLASGSVDTDFQGFIGLIHNSGSFPLVSQFGFQISPGSNNMVALSAMKVDANVNIRSVEVKRRKCRFPGRLILPPTSSWQLFQKLTILQVKIQSIL